MSKNNSGLPLTYNSWDLQEYKAIKKTLNSNILTQNKTVLKLEDEIAKYHNRKYCIMVNSGSSANLLGVAAMKFKKSLNIRDNDEFLVPGIGWSTSYSPFIQNNINLKFIDVEEDTFNLKPEELEKKITKKTKGVLAINILGNPCNFSEIKKICKKNNLILVEDNCESMGARYKKKLCGSFGLWSSLSSYYSHHISTIEGGYLLTDDEELFSIALALRSHGWVREQKNMKYFDQKKFSLEKRKFLFYLPGYNIRSSELNAAAGLIQLKKLNKFIINRRRNYKIFNNLIKDFNNIKIQKENHFSSWFGFGLIFDTSKNKFNKIVKILNQNNIDTRPIVTGDFTKQPVMKYYLKNKKKYNLKNCRKINDFGIMIGNSHVTLNKQQLKNIKLTFSKINNIIKC